VTLRRDIAPYCRLPTADCRNLNMADVTLSNIRKVYPGAVEAVKGVSIDIPDGGFCVLVGPSGCGKSTLLRMVAGLESITAGECRIGGRVVNDIEPADRDIAMVFQNYALYPHMSVYDNMAYGLRNRGTPKDEIERRVQEAAKILAIETFLQRKPRQLSGGQRQRVAMGRAIVRRPKVFLFDEPLSNLDAQLRAEVRIEIKKLHQRFGTTIIYVTHDQVEAMTLAERIAVLKGGHLEQFASPDDIYNRPASKFVAGFMGSPPMSFARVTASGDGRTLAMPDGSAMAAPVGLSAGKAYDAGFRPEHIRLGDAGGGGHQPMKARVEILEPLGAETLALLTVGGATLTGRFPQQAGVKPGDEVTVSLAVNAIQLFEADSGRALAA
jgi:ABC-type sugar transport system ATPase subunit